MSVSTTNEQPETRAGPTTVGERAGVAEVIVAGVVSQGPTSGTLPYEAVKHLVTNRPIHRQAFRPLPRIGEGETVEYEDEAEEAQDVEDVRRILADPNEGRISLDDLRRELGI